MPGCLVLGVNGSVESQDIEQLKKRRPIYVTRYRIDSYRQSNPLCREAASEMFVPCAGHNDNRPVTCIWHIFKSELMLFVLHMSTLVFGVFKEALDMRHVDDRESFHLAHTVIETIVTLLIIILRMINTRMGYIEVQVTVQRLQHFDPVHEPHLRAVWTWMWLLLAAGLLTFVTCIVCFVVFDQLAHLGWTILSNQACIITMRLLDGFYESRIHAAVKKIKEDQHKVVIHEALMLLKEISTEGEADSADGVKLLPTTTTAGSSDSVATVRRFVKAAFNTKSLAKPRYIVIAGDGQPQHSSHDTAPV